MSTHSINGLLLAFQLLGTGLGLVLPHTLLVLLIIWVVRFVAGDELGSYTEMAAHGSSCSLGIGCTIGQWKRQCC